MVNPALILAVSIAPPQVHYYSEALPTDTVSEFHAEAQAQGPYVAARAGVEPTTLRTEDVDLTNEPSRPKINIYINIKLLIQTK